MAVFLLLSLCVTGFAKENSNTRSLSAFPAGYPIVRREILVIQDMRTIFGAQATYQSSAGNGQYGTFYDLYFLGVINQSLSSGSYQGYYFTMVTTPSNSTQPARFYVQAVPQNFLRSGRRSFYIDETGVLRGAIYSGQPATANDPLIDF